MTQEELRSRYLDLMRDCLTGAIYDDPALAMSTDGGLRPYDPATRELGMDWPARAHSMIGRKRMLQLQRAAEFVIERQVPGDLIETGVWRGGASILMRGVLAAWRRHRPERVGRRLVRRAADAGRRTDPIDRAQRSRLPRPRDLGRKGRGNFALYDLLDDQVRFLDGCFSDSLRGADQQARGAPPRRRPLRVDDGRARGPLRQGRPRGFVIVDDYGVFPNCRAAVADFRGERGIHERIYNIDGSGVFWQRGVA